MPGTHAPYPPEFRRQIVDLVRSGRSIEELAKEFERVESATALIWKLLLVAEKRFRRLDAPHLLKDVFEGRDYLSRFAAGR